MNSILPYISITTKHDNYRCNSCRRTFRKPDRHHRCPFCHHKHYRRTNKKQ
jgi:rRNA maturation endonuclease Nob1